MSDSAGESEVRDRVLRTLSRDFEINTEVSGKHWSGRTMRIDAIVTPKVMRGWHSDQVHIGIEFKDVDRLRGDLNNFTSWLAQCTDYAETRFEGYGYLYVFTCPSFLENMAPAARKGAVDMVLSRLMKRFGVGELRESDRYGWTFFLNQSDRIWSERYGLEKGQYYSLDRSFGSR